jgi:hypothetical protein
MKQRYYYIFNGRWGILLKGEMLYDIIDVFEDKVIASTNSPVDVKHMLKKLNK